MIYTFFASGGTVFPITALPIPPGGDLIYLGIEPKIERFCHKVSFGALFPILPITNHQSPIPPGGDLIYPGIETKTDRLMLEVSFRPCHHYVIYSAHLLIFFFVFLILSINCKYFY